MSFMRTKEWNFGEISLTPRMLRVLSCIKGKTTLSDIERRLSVSFEELCNEIYNLLHLNLITFAENAHRKNSTDAIPAEKKYYPSTSPRMISAEIQ